MKELSHQKFVLILVLCLVFGVFFGIGGHLYFSSKKVAIRVGQPKESIDYDMQAAINYLADNFKSKGYYVSGIAYGGEMYPKDLDDAGVNVYVRGMWELFDVRREANSKNIIYILRDHTVFGEEMRNFDVCISSQKSILRRENNSCVKEYLAGGAVKHKRLEPQYEDEVLFIYEHRIPEFEQFLSKYPRYKIYSSVEFAALSSAKQQEELARAKLVVYQPVVSGIVDRDYVPYAVYDIISYGRPLATAYHPMLEKMMGANVYFYFDKEGMERITDQALSESDEGREQKGEKARALLF